MQRLVLLKVGSTLPVLVARGEDYDLWFRRSLGIGERLDVVRVFEGEPLPDLNVYRGVVVSGSPAMVTERAPWSLATATFLLEAMARDVPVLGVCYGHQLLADACGAQVDFNPRGRQIGTVHADLTAAGQADPLFENLPARLVVQTSHSQSVLALPEGLTCLAQSGRDPQHAFRVVNKQAWGVQFHPEFDAQVTRTYIEQRSEAIRSEGQDPDALLSAVVESDHGSRILQRFAALCGIS